MPSLDTRDVKEILDMLEDEINFIPKLDSIRISFFRQDRRDVLDIKNIKKSC